ncbi:hypothetical protein [Halosegnis marinus]|uniref:Uncharacterized protein n=1 Tax=Halosegnis marinus TaxID=3034023 RepID=A0ABD5ZKM8_9EURY|nr:hypothetical protein [Halosegnis sp. DT85]
MTEDRTLGETSHTNPYTDETFGETQTYGRGRVVAADGGERDSSPEPDTMADVDHTPRENAPSANAAYDPADGSV